MLYIFDVIHFNEKTGKDFLTLLGHTKLLDYKYCTQPQRGFNENNIKEVINKSRDFYKNDTFFVLFVEKVKIQENTFNLLWDKHNGELIHYVDLGNIDINHASL